MAMVRRRSTVRFRKGAPEGLHVSPGSIFTFGSDASRGRPFWAVFAVAAWVACRPGMAGWCGCLGCDGLVAVLGSPAGSRRGACGGQVGEGLAAPAAGAGRQAGRGAAGVVGLAGGPGVKDPLVAHDEQAGEPEHEGGQAISRVQPRAMLLLAGSLAVEKVRSAPVRRA